MGAFTTLAFLAGLGFPAEPADAERFAPVDLTQVDAVEVTGGGVAVAASTDAGRSLVATLDQAEGCAATMRVEGRRLTVDIQRASSFWPRDCRPTLALNLHSGADLVLRPAAVSATLNGRFGTVAVAAEAAELSLTGRVWALDVSAKALKATIHNTSPDPGQAIRIEAKAADIDLGFRRGTPVGYAVDARVAMVDSEIPTSAGGQPLVTIKGDFVRAHIGYDD
jgi:hypothetical protein